MRGDQFAEVGEQRAVLLAAGDGDRERALGEAFTVVALGAEREFSVDDGAAERALGGIVGGLDAVQDGEGPQGGPDLEQVVGELAVPAGPPALRAGCLEQASEFGLDRGDLGLELVAVVVLVLVGAPGGEHLVGERDALFSEGFLFAQTVGVAAEITLEVRPAHLPPGGVEMGVAVPAVRDHDP